MERDVRIRISAGLLSAALLHAVIFAAIFAVIHQPAAEPSRDLVLPPARPYPGQSMGEMRGESIRLPPVNASARDEIKQQSCPTCPQLQPSSSQYVSTQYQAQAQAIANAHGAAIVTRRLESGQLSVYASLDGGKLWASTGQASTRAYSGPNAFLAVIADMRSGVQSPPTPQPTTPATPPRTPYTPPATPVTPGPTQQASRHQIAIFADGTAKSQQLLNWFDSDQQLAALKARVDFQVYTSENALYRHRYADQVPVDQFPAILFLQPDGGHIHAAGKTMLPRSATELYADLRSSFDLAQSAEPLATGLIRETGYSWDAAINPQMQLQSGDCPDGWCPDDTNQRPRLGERLFDRVQDQKEVMLWAGLQELIAVLLIVFAGILVIIIAIKRR